MLAAWWLGLHCVLAAALLLAGTGFGPAGLALLAILIHCRWRWPASPRLIVLSAGGRFGLPLQGRFDLAAVGGSRIGPWWAEIVLEDSPRPVLILRDQLAGEAWRRLTLTLRESE